MAKCTLLLLLLSLWAAEADIMKPILNIIEEVEKLKSIDDRLRTLEDSLQKQNRVVEKLQKENGDLKSKVGTLWNEKEDLKTKVGKLQKEKEDLKTKVGTLQKDKEDLKSKVGTLWNEKEAKKVAFSASLIASGRGHIGPFENVTSTLIYKRVHTNVGNGYSSDTGIFTAPRKGVYYFRFYAHSQEVNKMAVSLYKNDVIQCSVFALKPVFNGNAGNGVVLILNQGDQISTKLWSNSWVYDSSGRFTSFGGFLLFPL
ncbi:cerebellin-2-like [Hoplias malabaricus]|uniref:cerebellin-2-like n=1 Tax=Hoplias malabaricus TaxID=27720 RepID=UPI0034630B0E